MSIIDDMRFLIQKTNDEIYALEQEEISIFNPGADVGLGYSFLRIMYNKMLIRGENMRCTPRDMRIAQRYAELKDQKYLIEKQIEAIFGTVLEKVAKVNYNAANARDNYAQVMKELASYRLTPPGDVFPMGGVLYQEALDSYRNAALPQKGGRRKGVKSK